MSQLTGWSSRPDWEPEVRIANPPPALLSKYTEKEKAFFYDYADFVLRVIGDEFVNDGLRRIILMENVRFGKPVDIRVMVFPARPIRGRSNRTLHGSYSHTASQISLYPLKIPRDWAKTEGQDLFRVNYASMSPRKKHLLYEISETAIATLIHEILHVKFEGRGMSSYVEESIVRKLERQYMQGWESSIDTAVERALP